MEAPTPQDGQPHLLFQLGGIRFALPLAAVQAVERPGRFTVVPFAAPWLRGVTAVNGAVVSVVDLGRFAGGTPAGTTPGARLVVSRWAGVTAGLLVDQVTGIAPVPAAVSPAPPVRGPLADYWRGAHTVEGEVAVVLDPQRLLHAAAFHAYQVESPSVSGGPAAEPASLE